MRSVLKHHTFWFILLMVASLWTPAGAEQRSIDSGDSAGKAEVMGQVLTGGGIWSTAVHEAGTVYFGSDDSCLWAVDLGAPKLRWKSCTGGRVRTKPAISEGLVYFASDDGFLYCVDASDGKLKWRFDLGSQGVDRVLPSPTAPYMYDYLSSSPVVQGEIVYIGSGNGSLYAIDAKSGVEKWHFATRGKIRSTPCVEGERLFIGSWDHHVYALKTDNGQEIWRFDTGGVVQASPAIGDGRVYIGSRNPKVFALDAANGEEVWSYVHEDGSWVESSGVFRDGFLYIGSSDALTLFAHDAETGKVRWKYRTGGWSWSTPMIADGTVYVGAISAFPYYFEGVTLEQGLHAVDLKTGERRWVLPMRQLPGFITGGVMATPVLFDGKLVVGSLDGRLLVISP